jgi:putative copper resistance protein D
MCVTVATAATLPLRAATIGEGWQDAIDFEMLASVALETTVGTAWLCQVVATLLLLATSALPSRYRLSATAVMCALLVCSLAVTGHAAMNEGWLRTIHQANDIVHMLAGGAWLGALLPLLIVLRPLADPSKRQQARTALIRFSTAGHVAVAVVILSGIANTLLVLGRLPTDWNIAYQRLLTIKIGLVAVMTLIAILNRYVFVPRLARSSYSTSALAIGTTAEIILGLFVIGLVAWFGMLEPFP